MADRFIDALNTSAKANITELDESAVAAADPLLGPNVKPTGASVAIPLNTARREDLLERQAEAIGIPLEKIYLPFGKSKPCTNEVYEQIMAM